LVGHGGYVALVHATAYSDDRQVMEYLAKQLRALDLRTTLISPAHLRFEHQQAVIRSRFASGSPDGLIRFFPAEWLPMLGHTSRWAGFFSGGVTALSNPGTALLLQTKRMPLVWDRVASRMNMWRTLLPEIRCPRNIPERGRDEWVLKPALGRVGEGVGIAGVTEPGEFDRIVRLAQQYPSQWVAQQRFCSLAVETPEGPRYPCLGVFTVDGRAAGCYGRVSAKPLTDADSQDVAVLIESENGSAT
jgi:glutathionylspermidine synthase